MTTRAEPSAVTAAASRLQTRLRRALRVLRTIIGEPDYDRYVEHMRSHHPGCAIASRDDFMTQRMEDRYTRPGSRCC